MDTLRHDSHNPTIWVTYKDSDDLTEVNQDIQDIVENIKLDTVSRSARYGDFPSTEHIQAAYYMFDVQIFVIDGKFKNKVQLLLFNFWSFTHTSRGCMKHFYPFCN